MHTWPYILGFSAFCLALGIGISRRSIWVWYAGWIVLYLLAALLGIVFFAALSSAATPLGILGAVTYFIGGVLIWGPPTYLWSRHKHLFGRRKDAGGKNAKR
jgi:hypothetical protein